MVEWNKADGIFNVSLPERSMEFTGERMTTAIEGEIEFEHFHRYCLARDLCPGLDVLDVASGEGYGSSILANVARSVIGVDVDPAAIAHARTTYGGENLRFVQGSALDLPLGDASVDAVVSFETLEHVREHARFMAEVKRVLRPGGKLIVSTPERAVYSARGEPVNKYHLLELTVAEFDSLLRANFRHVSHIKSASHFGLSHCEGRRRRPMAKLRTAITGVYRGERWVDARAFPGRDRKRRRTFACPFLGLPGSTAARRSRRGILAIAGVPIASSRDQRGDRPPERRGGDARCGDRAPERRGGDARCGDQAPKGRGGDARYAEDRAA